MSPLFKEEIEEYVNSKEYKRIDEEITKAIEESKKLAEDVEKYIGGVIIPPRRITFSK